jgi:hypothetical protein
MVRTLRKYHFYAWRIFGIALPLFFAAAIIYRPHSNSNYNRHKDDFHFSARKLTNSSIALTVTLANALRAPSCLVYAKSENDEILLGKIGQRGTYNFVIPAAQSITVRLYDPIRDMDIAQQTLDYKE